MKGQLFDGKKFESLPGSPLARGYSLKYEGNKVYSLYLYEDYVRRIDFKDAAARRLFLVELVSEYGFSKRSVHLATGVSRQTIDNNLGVWDKYGKEGLIHSYRTKDGGKIKQREQNSNKLYTGNKAVALANERKRILEDASRKQLELPLDFKQESESIDFSNNCEEVPCRYAGSFIYHAIIEKSCGLTKLLSDSMGELGLSVWLFIMMLVHKIPSVEQLKGVFREEFGLLLGLKRLPSKPTIWALLTKAYELEKAALILKDLFIQNVKRGIISLYLLYVDGHFIPYTGKKPVRKAYNTQRRLALPGRTMFIAFDHSGNFVNCRLHEGKGDFLGAVKDFASEASELLEGTRPIFICDRELWGVDNFMELEEENIDFVTWEKGTRKSSVDKIKDELFTKSIEINDKEHLLYEGRKKSYTSYKSGSTVALRRIVVWNKASDKRSVCVSNIEDASTEFLAFLMLNRWGRSENENKRAKERWNSDYTPGYKIEDLSDFQDVSNPKLKQIDKQIASLQNKEKRLAKKLALSTPKTNKDGKLRINRKREKKQREFDDLIKKISDLKKQKAELPERVPLSSLKDKEFLKIESESKKLFTFAHAVAFNAEKQLVELLRKHYFDRRDPYAVLDIIRKCAGWITIRDDRILVELETLDTKQYQVAQKGLLLLLNDMNVQFPNGKRLVFDLRNRDGTKIGLSKNLG